MPLAAAATGGYGMAERLSPCAESMGGTASRPHGTLDTQERAHATTLSSL